MKKSSDVMAGIREKFVEKSHFVKTNGHCYDSVDGVLENKHQMVSSGTSQSE